MLSEEVTFEALRIRFETFKTESRKVGRYREYLSTE